MKTCCFTFCDREQGAGTWTQVDVLDIKVHDAQIANIRTVMTATVHVNERNVMLPVCEEHWAALRSVR